MASSGPESRRIVVVGGYGFFGSAVCEQLRARGLALLRASRRAGAELVLDAEDEEAIRKALRRGDVVVDAAGPFQTRSTTLVRAAAQIGADVVDLADHLNYVRNVYALDETIAAAGVRVFTACSSISAISAAAVRHSGIAAPVRLSGVLVPATRYSAVAATAQSLWASVGLPVEVLEDGRPARRVGWRQARQFQLPGPLGNVRGYLFQSADAVTLPRVWPSLQTVDFYVDTNVRGLNGLFTLAARSRGIRRLMGWLQRPGLRLSRWLGRTSGGLGYEIEGAGGRVVRLAFSAGDRGYLTAVAPAVLAASALAADQPAGELPPPGVVPASAHVDPQELIDELAACGVRLDVDGAGTS